MRWKTNKKRKIEEEKEEEKNTRMEIYPGL